MILYRHILKKHIPPFFYSLAIIIFVFMMNLATQLLDKILNKGLEPLVILEIFLINLAWVVVLAIPMAVLAATLMAFGGMSADNEIRAIKASGCSLYSLLTPVLAAAAVIAVLLVYFNNLIYPDANHKAASLLADISRKKPAAAIEPNVLISYFDHYVIHVREVDYRTGALGGIKVFSDIPGEDPTSTVAESGMVSTTAGARYVRLTLYNGETHRISRTNRDEYVVVRFDRQVLYIRNVDSELGVADQDQGSGWLDV